ncbi:MAG: DUF47 family protein [Ignavibacteria bacterium]|nr:DUF47 family protein [Ignavibacteria bacterium]MDH7528295.1 DUF47 family protein [Ignavibacteria bacterium]
MLKKLIPKEEKYFEYFNQLASLLSEIAGDVYKLYTDVKDIDSIVSNLKNKEHQCDKITSAVRHQLNHTFVTPFDREDILQLVKRMDDIADILLVAASRFQIFKISEKIDYTDEIARIVKEQTEVINHAIHNLKQHKSIIDECDRVKHLESEADNIYHQALTNLFEKEKDAISLIKKKEILDVIERASDICQSVARIIESITIKNA